MTHSYNGQGDVAVPNHGNSLHRQSASPHLKGQPVKIRSRSRSKVSHHEGRGSLRRSGRKSKKVGHKGKSTKRSVRKSRLATKKAARKFGKGYRAPRTKRVSRKGVKKVARLRKSSRPPHL